MFRVFLATARSFVRCCARDGRTPGNRAATWLSHVSQFRARDPSDLADPPDRTFAIIRTKSKRKSHAHVQKGGFCEIKFGHLSADLVREIPDILILPTH